MAESKAASVTSKPAPSTAPPSTYAAGGSGGAVTLNMYYFRTGPGIIKLVEIALAILCMICTAPSWSRGTHWFLFVVVTAFVATVLWCFIYVLSLREAVNLPIDWLLTELLNTGITTVLYFIAVIVQFCSIDPNAVGATVMGGVFGLINAFVYTVGCFLLYRDWKDTHPVSSFSVGPPKV